MMSNTVETMERHEVSGPESLEVQLRLHRHYSALLAEPARYERAPTLAETAQILPVEERWVADMDTAVNHLERPAKPGQFLDWYLAQSERHAVATRRLTEYLSDGATLQEMALFFVVEEKVDSKFDDLMALAQLGASGPVKMAIGKNYWDEMGNGDPALVHTTMFDHSVQWMKQHLDPEAVSHGDTELTEVYSNANQLLMYGLNRRFLPRLLGALGVLEHTASDRFLAMTRGCERLGVPDDVIKYQKTHVTVDGDHGQDWLDNVLVPLVGQDEPLFAEICMGVLTRIEIATRYYERVRSLFMAEC